MGQTYFTRAAKDRGYTILSTKFLQDGRLSWKAKGLLAYLLSLPEDWHIYLSEVETRSSDGRSSLRSAVQELTDFGYISQHKTKDEKGLWAGNIYEVIEDPSQLCEKRLADNRLADNRLADNRPLVKTNSNKDLKEKTTSIDVEPPQTLRQAIKKSKKTNDIVTIKGMLNTFTENEAVKEKLREYLKIRQTKGLQASQWQLILDDLRSFTNGNADLAIEKINNAIAGGYMTLVAPWEKAQHKKTAAPKFDNTSDHVVESAVDMNQEEFEETLAKDDNGNPITF